MILKILGCMVTLRQFTLDFLFHFEGVLEEVHAVALIEAATEHSVVLDAFRVDVIHTSLIDYVSGKVDPVRCQKADTAGQKRDSQQKEADGACQTHHDGRCNFQTTVSTCNDIDADT